MRAFPILRALGYPVVYDVTHSLQLPGAATASRPARRSSSSRWRRAGVARRRGRRVHGSPRGPAAARRATRRTRCKLDLLRAAARPARADPRDRSRAGASRRDDADETGDDSGARAGAQGAADRGGRDPRPGRSPRRRLRARPAAAVRMPRPGDRHRHGQVRASSAARSPRRSRAPARPRSSCTRPKRSTATSARSAKTTWCWRCRTAARPRSWSGCSSRSGGSARRLIAITGVAALDARRGRPTSRSTAASPRRPAR